MFGIAAFAEVPFASLATTGTAYAVSVSENISVADALSAVSSFFVSQTELITVADAFTAVANFPVSQTEPLTLADSSVQVSRFFVSPAEAVTLADASTQVTAYKPNMVEPVTLADASTQVTAYKPNMVEPVTLADTSTQVTAYKPNMVEPVTLADASTQVTAYKPAITETVIVADLASAPVNFPVAPVENLTLGDAQTAVTTYVPAVVENLTLVDAAGHTTSYYTDQTEPITLADTPAPATGYNTTQTEPVTLADTSAQVTAYAYTAVENLILADIIAPATSYYASPTESITLADLASAPVRFPVDQVENLIFADYQTSVTAYTQSPTENITLLDGTAITGWIKIQDDQNASWNLVNDASGQTLPDIRDWIASATSGETTLVIGRPTSGAYYVARKYKQNAWYFSPLPFVISTHTLRNIRWLEDQFYLVGVKSGGASFIATSNDGITWTEITSPTGSLGIFDIAKNGSTLVVAAAGRVYYSTNSGTSWTSTTRTLSSARPSILWVEELNKFFVVGFNVYSSPDGATWTAVAAGGLGTGGFTGIAWSGSELVTAISNSSGSTSKLQRSSDGVNWTTFGAGNNHDVTKVMWDGTQFLFYGDGNSYNYYIYTGSGSALTVNPNSISGYRVVNSATSYNMVIVDGLYVIPGYQNDASKHYFYTSTDLITFSSPDYPGLWTAIGASEGVSWGIVSTAQPVMWDVISDTTPTTWQNINNQQ